MNLPKIRYYLDGRVHSDWVEIECGEAMCIARLQKCDDGQIHWVDQSGLKLDQLLEPSGQSQIEEGTESQQSDAGVQSGNTAQRQTGTGKRTRRKKS